MEKWTVIYKTKGGVYVHISVMAKDIIEALEVIEKKIEFKQEEAKIMCIRAEYKRAND